MRSIKCGGEQKRESLLRGTRYLWLRNPTSLSERQRAMLDNLPRVTSRQPALTGSGWRSRNSMTSHRRRRPIT